jgi:hypothetical protein
MNAQATTAGVAILGKSAIGELWTSNGRGAMGAWTGRFSPGWAEGVRRLLKGVGLLHCRGPGVKVLLTKSAQKNFMRAS